MHPPRIRRARRTKHEALAHGGTPFAFQRNVEQRNEERLCALADRLHLSERQLQLASNPPTLLRADTIDSAQRLAACHG